MILEHHRLDLLERGAHRRKLGQNVDAIAIVLDHPLQAADLPLDPTQSLQLVFSTLRTSMHSGTP